MTSEGRLRIIDKEFYIRPPRRAALLLLVFIGLQALGGLAAGYLGTFANAVMFMMPSLLLYVIIPIASADMFFYALGYAADLIRRDASPSLSVILWFFAAILLYLFWLYMTGSLLCLIVTAVILLLRIVIRQI